MRLKNLRACETRKESSRNAARNRRSVEAQIFRDMLSMLPINQTMSTPSSSLFNGESLSVDALSPLKAPFLQRALSMSSPNGNANALFVASGMHIDKISIVRLSLAFIKLRQILVLHNSLLPDISSPPHDKASLNQGFSSLDVIEKQKSLSERVSTGREILRALDCFFMIVSGNGTLLYLSDNVENLIGISKMCLLGQKLIDLVHPCDLKLFSGGLQHTNDSFDETACNNNNNNMKMARKFGGQNYSSDSSSPPSLREFQREDRCELMSKLASEETNVTASNKNNSPSLYSKPVDMILRLKSLTSGGGSNFGNSPNNCVDELNIYRGDRDERKSSFITFPNSPNHVLSKSSPETSPVRDEAASVARKSIISNNNNNCSLSGVNNNKVISEKCWPDLSESSIFLVNPTTAPAATGATVHHMRLNRPLTNQHNFKVMHLYGQTIFKPAKKRIGDPHQASFPLTDQLYPNSLNNGSSIVCSLLVASPVFDQQLKSSIVNHFLNVPHVSPNKTMIEDAKTESKSVIYTPLSTFNKCIDIDHHSIAFMISKHKLDMKIIYFDERIAKLLGYEIWHLIGRSYFDFLHVLDLERFRKNMKSLHENGEFETGYYRLLAQTGGYAWINTQATTFIHSTDTNFNSGSNHNALTNSIFRPPLQAATAAATPALHQSFRKGEDHQVKWNMNNYNNSLRNTNLSSIVAKQCNEINNGGEVVGCNVKEGEEGESFKRHNGDIFKGSERIMLDGMISNSPFLGNNTTMTPKMAEFTLRDSINRTAAPASAAPLTIRTGNFTTTFQRDYVKQIVCRHNIISHCENGDHVLSDSQSKAAILRGHDPKFKEFSTESLSSNVNLNGAWSSIHQNTEFLLNLPPRLKSSPLPPNSIIDPHHASKDLAILKFNKVLPQPQQQRLTVIRDKKSFSPDREICNRCPTSKTSLPEPFFVVPESGSGDDGDWGSLIQLDEDVGGAQEKPAIRYNISYLDPQGDAATGDQGCDSLGKAGTEDQAIIYNRAPSLIQLLPARLVSKNDIFLKDNHQAGSAKGKTSSKSKLGNRKKRGSIQNMISSTAPVTTKQLNHEVSVGETNLKARWTATLSPCVTTAKKQPTIDITDPTIERLSFLNGSRENFNTSFALTPTTGIYNNNSTAQYPNITTHLTEIQKLPGFPSSSNCNSNTEDSSFYKHIPTVLEYTQSGDLRHFTRERSDSIDNIIEDIISLEDDARRRLGESKNMALITTRNTLIPRAEPTNYHMVKMSRFDCNNNSINSTTAPLVYSSNFNCAGNNGYAQGKQPMILQNFNFERNQLNFSPTADTLQSPNHNRNTLLNNGLASVDNKRLSFSKSGHIINYNNLHHYNSSKSRAETWKNQQTFLPNLNHQEILVSSSGGTTYKYFDPPGTCNFKTNFPPTPTTPIAYPKNGNSKLVGVFNEIGDVFQMEPQQQLLNLRNDIYSPHGINGGTATPPAQTLFRSTKYHVDSLPILPNPITPNYNLNRKNGAVDNILWSPKTILSSSSKKKLDSKAVPKHYLNSVLVNLLKNGEDLNTGYKCQITPENEKSFVDYAASKSPRSFDVNDFTYDWPTLLNPLDQNFINIVDAADPAFNLNHLITSRDDKLSFDGRFQSYREATAATTTVPPINNKVMILVNNNNDTDTTNNNNNNNDLSLLFDQSSDLPVFLRDNLESPLLYENSLIEPLVATPSPENFFLNMFNNTLVDDPHVSNNPPSKLKIIDNHHQHSLTSDIFITDDYPNNTNHIFDDDNIVFPEESNVLDDLIY